MRWWRQGGEGLSVFSTGPRKEESVLLPAHGTASEEENERLLQAMDEVAAVIAKTPFRSVRSVALREDWPERRSMAEARIRDFVRQETAAGRRVIVVPMRLSGFGGPTLRSWWASCTRRARAYCHTVPYPLGFDVPLPE